MALPVKWPTRCTSETDSFRAAGAYKITDAFKLVGFYQTTEFDGYGRNNNKGKPESTSAQRDAGTFDVYGLGGEFAIAKNTALKATWMTHSSDAKKADADMWVVGNDDNAAYSPWMQSRTATPKDQSFDANGVNRAKGEKAAGFTVGLRYDF